MGLSAMREKLEMANSIKGSDMLIDERRQHVLSLIQRDGRVLVAELSETLGISRITIRKDLDYLESKGLVQRTHGGALAPRGGPLFDPHHKEKAENHREEKKRIAEAAAGLVQEGNCVVLDSGSTTTAIASRLRHFSKLTVITNALNIAAELADSDAEVLLTGGALYKDTSALVGPLAEDTLQEVQADIAFLGVNGFDPAVGLTTPNVLEARVNRAMARAAKKVVAVCDSSKFQKRSLALVLPPSSIDLVITDDQIPDSIKESLKASDIAFTVV